MNNIVYTLSSQWNGVAATQISSPCLSTQFSNCELTVLFSSLCETPTHQYYKLVIDPGDLSSTTTLFKSLCNSNGNTIRNSVYTHSYSVNEKTNFSLTVSAFFYTSNNIEYDLFSIVIPFEVKSLDQYTLNDIKLLGAVPVTSQNQQALILGSNNNVFINVLSSGFDPITPETYTINEFKDIHKDTLSLITHSGSAYIGSGSVSAVEFIREYYAEPGMKTLVIPIRRTNLQNQTNYFSVSATVRTTPINLLSSIYVSSAYWEFSGTVNPATSSYYIPVTSQYTWGPGDYNDKQFKVHILSPASVEAIISKYFRVEIISASLNYDRVNLDNQYIYNVIVPSGLVNVITADIFNITTDITTISADNYE